MSERKTTLVEVTVLVTIKHGPAIDEDRAVKEAIRAVGRNQSWTGHGDTWCHTRLDETVEAKVLG